MTDYGKANLVKQQGDDDKFDPWYPAEYIPKLDEDGWCIFTEKLQGAESRSTLKHKVQGWEWNLGAHGDLQMVFSYHGGDAIGEDESGDEP